MESVDENSPPRNKSLMEEGDLSVVGSSPLKAKVIKTSPPAKNAPAALTASKDAVKDAVKVVISKEEEVEDFFVAKKAPKDQDEELLMVGNVGGAGALQDSFKRFRKQKVKERRIMQMCKEELTTKGPRSQEFKDNLRMKFVEQAKKYLGVPYSERYKKEEDPVSPLYLDCCGLVRKVLQDLAEEFGFLIGRWNQAYQMDTLPIRKAGVHELKPGDLIFYCGPYNSTRSKSQKHDNVHVEIFLGGETGEATIGARFLRGKVSIFDSYKFPCTTWTCEQHHFCSIETWLDGVCESCCPEHPWLIDHGLMLAAAAGKKSIFNDDSDEDCSAGGYVDDEDDDVQVDIPTITCNHDTNDSATGCNGKIATDIPPPELTEGSALFLPKKDPSPEPVLTSNSAPSSPDNKIKASKKHRLPPGVEFIAMPVVSKSTTELKPAMPSKKTAKTTIAVSKSVDGSSIKKVSSKIDSGVNAKNSGENYVTPSVNANTADIMEYIPPKGNGIAGPPNTYYVAKSNGWRLVKAAMDKKGWQQLPFEYQFSSRFGLKWVERRSQIDYRSHQSGQLVCHIPNNEIITTKIGLLSSLRHKFCRVPIGSTERKATPWLPETYQLDIPADVNAALDMDKKEEAETGVAPVWIYKPSCNNRGRGIKVITGHEELREICVGKVASSKDADDAIKASEGVVQRYLEDPLLVPRGNDSFKFDYRCYMLVARNEPTYMCFFHPGYCRLTTKPYSNDRATLSDPIIHLTNASLQKKDPNYKENKDFQVQSLDEVAKRIEDSGNTESANYLRAEFHEQVKKCMTDLVKASSTKFMRKHGYFDLFGIDFMVTADHKTVLLEANTNPALSLDNAYLESTLPDMVDGCLDLVIGSQGPDRPRKEDRQDAADVELLDNVPGKWELIHDEKRKFWYQVKKAKAKACAGEEETSTGKVE